MEEKGEGEARAFNSIFVAMGVLLLGVAGWIALSVSHIPSIEQKLEDFIAVSNMTLHDHENRIRKLER